MKATVSFPCPVCKLSTELTIKVPKVLTPTVQWAICKGQFGGGCESQFHLRISKSRAVVGNVEFFILDARLSPKGDALFEEQKRNANPPKGDNNEGNKE